MTLKILTIKKSSDFKSLQNNCRKYHSETLILLESKTPSRYFFSQTSSKNLVNFCRSGITISKQVNKLSRTRNLIKRRIRNAVKDIASEHGKVHHDYVIIAKKQIIGVDYKKIYNDLKFCFKKI